MANITDFLPPHPIYRREEQSVIATVELDFAKKNAASGDTVEVMTLPAGIMVKEVILAVHTTQATVTIAVGDEASGTQFLSAQTLTDIKADANADDGAVSSAEATRKFYGVKGKKLIATIGGATAASALVSVTVRGTLVARTNYEQEVMAE